MDFYGFLKAQETPAKTPLRIDAVKDTTKQKDKITATVVLDTIVKDSLSKDSTAAKKGKSSLLDKIRYKAIDYAKISQKRKEILLYNEAEVYYEDTELKAGIIILNYEKKEVYAGRIKDSAGNYTQAPYFKQGSNIVEPDSIRFNYETKRALIWNSKTEQDGSHVTAEIVKKENDSTYFMYEGRLTTSKNPDDPDYYIRIRNAKFVPKKKIIAGFSNMYIADVPTPIAVPFAYFPLTQERTSGFIFPTFGELNNRGYFLQNGGYYFAVSDYFDLALTGDYYTNGSYGLRADTQYRKRYKFSGNLGLRYENLINSQRGFPDYSRGTIYNIRWSHSQDTKSSPSSQFSASVNLGSSRYYQNSLNQFNSPNQLNNTLQSSISYTKTFTSYPSVRIGVTASHQQNTRTESINMTLPTLTANMDRIYPFVKRNSSRKGIIDNINFQYSMRAENSITTTDSLFFKKEMFENARTGVRHDIPISTSFKLLKYFNLGMSTSINEVWQLSTIRINDYDPSLRKSTIDTIKGFDRFTTYDFNASIGTTIYGMFNFGTDKKIQAIRHTITPIIGYGYNPSFDQYFDSYVANEFGAVRQYTRFQGGLFGTPRQGFSNTMSISLINKLEAKVRDRDSTKTEAKKITLLNNLNFNTSYDFNTNRISPIIMTGSTNLFQNKMGINFGATFNPYAIDDAGTQLDVLNINNGGGLARLTNANLTMNYSFSSKNFKGKDNTNNVATGGRPDDLFGTAQDFSDSRTMGNTEEGDDTEEAPTEYYRTSIPWDLRVAYSLSYSNIRRESEISNNSLMFSGNIDITPKWKVGASSGYDFKNQGFTYTQLRFERDLDSWRLNFNWVPFSANSSWYFFIGIKSSMLSDLKWDKRKVSDRSLN